MNLYVGLSRQTLPGSPEAHHCSVARSSQEPHGSLTVCVTPGGPRAPGPQTGNPLGGSEARAVASVPSPCAHVQGTGTPGWVRPAVPPVFFTVLFVTRSLGAQVHQGSWVHQGSVPYPVIVPPLAPCTVGGSCRGSGAWCAHPHPLPVGSWQALGSSPGLRLPRTWGLRPQGGVSKLDGRWLTSRVLSGPT